MSPRPVFRFAPSPNGLLHLGHAFAALRGFGMARRRNGRFLLRIEDIDLTRSRPEFIDAIFEDLAWLGVTWQEPVLRQSQHFPLYGQAVQRLETMGLAYRCPATRAEIATAAKRCAPGDGPPPSDPDGAPLYPGLGNILSPDEAARRLAMGAPYAVRLDMAKARARVDAMRAAGGAAGPLTLSAFNTDGHTHEQPCRPEQWGDIVLTRKDAPGSYHLCVVIDDARQGVTHITRGLDLRAATGVHRVLQVLLGLPAPVYHHHRLILTEDGRKLSKSAGDISLRALRGAGRTPHDIRRLIGIDGEMV